MDENKRWYNYQPVNKNDELPNYICESCYNQLVKIHQFQARAAQSEKTLHRYLEQLYVSDKPTEHRPSKTPSVDKNSDLSEEHDTEDLINAVANSCTSNIEDNIIQDNCCDETELTDNNCEKNIKYMTVECDVSGVGCEDANVETKPETDTKIAKIDDNFKADVNAQCDRQINDSLEIEMNKKQGNEIVENTKASTSLFGNTIDNILNMSNHNIFINNKQPSKTPSVDKNSDLPEEHDTEDLINADANSCTSNIENNIIQDNCCDETELTDNNCEKNYFDLTKYMTVECDVSGVGCEDANVETKPETDTKIAKIDDNFKADVNAQCDLQINDSLEIEMNKKQGNEIVDNAKASTSLFGNTIDNILNMFNHNIFINNKQPTTKKPKLYECDICNKRFSGSSYFKVHMSRHAGKLPYQCNICDMGFIKLSILNKHKRTHTGEKPYECNVCNLRFTMLGRMNTHKQRMHSGEKPYHCEVCNKQFAQSYYLKIHSRIHTGEKPYECDVCKKCFSQSSALKTHKRSHTGEKPFECDDCKKCFTRLSFLRRHKRDNCKKKP